MKRYTLVIPYSDYHQRVVLLEKQSPAWQKGLLNFPGGKIEPNESGIACAARELFEETGIEVWPDFLNYMGIMCRTGDFEMMVYSVDVGSEILKAYSKDKEKVWVLTYDAFHDKVLAGDTIENVGWLWSIHRDGVSKKFVITYE